MQISKSLFTVKTSSVKKKEKKKDSKKSLSTYRRFGNQKERFATTLER